MLDKNSICGKNKINEKEALARANRVSEAFKEENMNGLNKGFYIGHLVRDPETGSTSKGSVTKMTVAVNRNWVQDGEKKEAVDFIPLVAWGKAGRNLCPIPDKGLLRSCGRPLVHQDARE